MRRLEREEGPDVYRYKIVDDSITTWAILDQDENKRIYSGLSHLAAREMHAALNSYAENEVEDVEERYNLTRAE